MRMTIEEIIKSFDYIKHVGNGESTYEHCREEIALDEAVAIMRKYQKIQEILDDFDLEVWEVLEKIKEVIKDENDNQHINGN